MKPAAILALVFLSACSSGAEPTNDLRIATSLADAAPSTDDAGTAPGAELGTDAGAPVVGASPDDAGAPSAALGADAGGVVASDDAGTAPVPSPKDAGGEACTVAQANSCPNFGYPESIQYNCPSGCPVDWPPVNGTIWCCKP